MIGVLVGIARHSEQPMSVRSCRSLTALLQAAILLAITVAPPGTRHSHLIGGGSRGHHRHEFAERHGHVHDGKPHRGSHDDSNDAEIGEGPSWHVHIHLLGFDFTIPEPVSNSSDRESPGTPELMALVLGQDVLSCPATLPNSVKGCEPPSVFPFPLFDAALMQVVVNSDPPVSCAPLCDRARQERSGVLLA